MQACQRGDSDTSQQPEGEGQHLDMAAVAYPDRDADKHIELRRPNTLLITTLPGVAAHREAYTLLIVRQISQANGEKCFRDMHQAACQHLERDYPFQVIELLDTCKRKIVLPSTFENQNDGPT